MSSLSGVQLIQRRPKKPVRMLSGVHVVTVAMMPGSCPHGKCVYCPGGVDQGTPQSYILDSPVVAKALPFGYHPYLQVSQRIQAYRRMGHSPSKVELIIIGGTFPSYPQAYQEWFVTQCLEALNRAPDPDPPLPSTLRASQMRNEVAELRCVGMTIETRPDHASQEEVNLILNYGVTRVEMGVQTVFNDVLKRAGRAHSIDEVKEATKTLKDSGFKLCYHMMLGLPGMNPTLDLEAFDTIFRDPSLRPDMIKIYPTLVLKGTPLFQMWETGRYTPYSDDETVELVTEIKRKIPAWVRINRVQREIPSRDVVAGISIVNLREKVDRRMKEQGWTCHCIRCREIGHNDARSQRDEPIESRFRIRREDYNASGGVEVFLSYENDSGAILAGFLRLRVPSLEAKRWEFSVPTAIVRELHVFGCAVPVGSQTSDGVQHRGLGSRLLGEAEDIARNDFGRKQIAVISGIGVRDYYRARGYRRSDHSTYMLKLVA